jgi:hypothetical protein
MPLYIIPQGKQITQILFTICVTCGFIEYRLLCERTSFFLSFIPQSLAQTAGLIAPGQAEFRNSSVNPEP